MTYTGKITDTKGNVIPGAIVLFKNDTNQEITSFNTDASGKWFLDDSFDDGLLTPGMQILFTAPGYTSYGITASALLPTFNVQLEKKISTVAPWAIAIVLAIALAIVASKKKKGKVGAIETKDLMTIFYIVGGIIAFTVIKKILESLNIWSSPEKKKLNDLASDPGSFWSPTFWQAYNVTITESKAKDLISNLINNAFGIIYDSPENALAVFKQLTTKANVSYMAYVLNQDRGQDLLTLLRNGGGIFPWDGLSDANVLLINDYVASLPND